MGKIILTKEGYEQFNKILDSLEKKSNDKG